MIISNDKNYYFAYEYSELSTFGEIHFANQLLGFRDFGFRSFEFRKKEGTPLIL